MDGIKLEILQYSYWEHFKAEKDLHLTLPESHPRRIALIKAREELLEKINAYTNK